MNMIMIRVRQLEKCMHGLTKKRKKVGERKGRYMIVWSPSWPFVCLFRWENTDLGIWQLRLSMDTDMILQPCVPSICSVFPWTQQMPSYAYRDIAARHNAPKECSFLISHSMPSC